MANIINSLDNYISKVTVNKLKSLSTAELMSYLELLITEHKTFVNTLDMMSKNDTAAFTNMFKEKAVSKAKQYFSIVGKLESRAKEIEATSVLGSFKIAAQGYLKRLDEIKNVMRELYDTKVVNVYTTKMSQVLIYGYMGEAQLIADANLYLFDLVSSTIIDDLPEPPKYRLEFLVDHRDFIAYCINKVCNRATDVSVLANVKELANTNTDVLIVDDNNNSNVKYLSPDYSTSLIGNVRSFINLPNPFRLIGEIWNVYKRAQISKRETEKEWMEAHVALLRLEMADIPHDSKEYMKLVKIIENYENMINKYDKMLNEYYNE